MSVRLKLTLTPHQVRVIHDFAGNVTRDGDDEETVRPWRSILKRTTEALRYHQEREEEREKDG